MVLRCPCVFSPRFFCFPCLHRSRSQLRTIRANVPLVLAPVTVTDKKGNFIDGLTVDDFRLTDDGVPQKIRMDTSDTVLAPVSLVVLIQASGISAPALARIERVGGMIKPLVIGERGQAAVIEFDDEIRVCAGFHFRFEHDQRGVPGNPQPQHSHRALDRRGGRRREDAGHAPAQQPARDADSERVARPRQQDETQRRRSNRRSARVWWCMRRRIRCKARHFCPSPSD